MFQLVAGINNLARLNYSFPDVFLFDSILNVFFKLIIQQLKIFSEYFDSQLSQIILTDKLTNNWNTYTNQIDELDLHIAVDCI